MATSLKNYLAANIGTSDVVAFQASTVGVQITIIGLNIANTSANSVNANIKLTSGGTTAFLLKNTPIPAGNALSVLKDSKLVMEYGDILYVNSSAAASLDAVISSVEVTP